MSSVVEASASVFAKDRSVEDEVDGDDHDEDIKQCRSSPICSTKFIPLDIAACILLRLPAKSIGRFRCVCRQWRSLTHDHCFIDEHRVLGGASASLRLMESEKICSKTLMHHRLPPQMPSLKIHRETVEPTLPIYEVGPNCEEIKRGSVDIEFDDGAGPEAYVFSNSVNGLIGMMSNSTSTPDQFLLNPITREMSPLPRPLHMVRPFSAFYGLGFDSSRGAYKLVIIHPVTGTLGCSSFTVLTVGSRTCRHIGDAPLAVRSRPVFLHGAIHWLANTSDHQPGPTGRWLANTSDQPASLCILAFDVEHETLRFIPAPKILASAPNHMSTVSLNLRALEGHMCVVEVSKYLRAGMRIWMLTNYTSHEWKPVYEIDISPLMNQTGAHLAFDVLGILDGQVLIQSKDAIYSYDLHGRTLRRVFCGDFPLGLDVVTESLVSPRDLIGMV